MGSYWGPRIAAFDPRVKALVGAMGNYLQKDTIFKHSKPAYRANYMYMSNTYDEDAFDAMAAQMTLRSRSRARSNARPFWRWASMTNYARSPTASACSIC